MTPLSSSEGAGDRTGARLLYREPPIPPGEAGEISRAVYDELREEFLPDILTGRHGADALFTVGTALVEGALAACCWMGVGRKRPELGVLAGVVTLPRYRGRGLATRMVGDLCDLFDHRGGRTLFLGVSNPVARRIYEKLGFRRLTGRILARGDSCAVPPPESPANPCRSRRATPGDIAAVVPLYLDLHPAVLLDARIGLPSSRIVEAWRCVRIFWDSWNSTQEGGRWHLLECASGLVGSALARPAAGGYEVDFLWRTSHAQAGTQFTAEFLDGLNAPCDMRIAQTDAWKLTEALRLGFRPLPGAEEDAVIQGQNFSLRRFRRGGPGLTATAPQRTGP